MFGRVYGDFLHVIFKCIINSTVICFSTFWYLLLHDRLDCQRDTFLYPVEYHNSFVRDFICKERAAICLCETEYHLFEMVGYNFYCIRLAITFAMSLLLQFHFHLSIKTFTLLGENIVWMFKHNHFLGLFWWTFCYFKLNPSKVNKYINEYLENVFFTVISTLLNW